MNEGWQVGTVQGLGWIHGYMDTWIHMDRWIHGYMDTWIHGYMYTWIHGYMDDTRI